MSTADRGRAAGAWRPVRPTRAPAAALPLLAAALALAVAATACGGSEDPPAGTGEATAPPMEVLFRVSSLSAPESVAWDSARRRWLVTGTAGASEGDGSGYVSAISRGGDTVVRRAHGVSGAGPRLDGPRGIAVAGDRAYVADLRRVVALDLAGDSLLWSRELDGRGPLDDVAVGPEGGIYVSDPDADAVWRVERDGSGARRLGAAGSLRGPSGLLVDRGGGGAGHLLVAGREGALLALAPDSSVTLLAGWPAFRRLDGLQAAPDGGLLVSDLRTGRLHHLRRRGEGVWQAGVPWLTGLDEPADFLVRGSVLALPERGADRVTFYRLGGG